MRAPLGQRKRQAKDIIRPTPKGNGSVWTLALAQANSAAESEMEDQEEMTE